jgi:hypothetical protein
LVITIQECLVAHYTNTDYRNRITDAITSQAPTGSNTFNIRVGNGYKPTGFSLLRFIPTKEKSSRQVTYLISQVEF